MHPTRASSTFIILLPRSLLSPRGKFFFQNLRLASKSSSAETIFPNLFSKSSDSIDGRRMMRKRLRNARSKLKEGARSRGRRPSRLHAKFSKKRTKKASFHWSNKDHGTSRRYYQVEERCGSALMCGLDLSGSNQSCGWETSGLQGRNIYHVKRFICMIYASSNGGNVGLFMRNSWPHTSFRAA